MVFFAEKLDFFKIHILDKALVPISHYIYIVNWTGKIGTGLIKCVPLPLIPPVPYLLNRLFPFFRYVPDETWQSVEVSHRLVFGTGENYTFCTSCLIVTDQHANLTSIYLK
jgi:hypothetical protein